MKKLDFRNFSVPTGITRQTREVFDAREQIADLLYTRVSGIKAHRLAFKIFESTVRTAINIENQQVIKKTPDFTPSNVKSGALI